MLLSQLRHPKPIRPRGIHLARERGGRVQHLSRHPGAHNRPYGRKLRGPRSHWAHNRPYGRNLHGLGLAGHSRRRPGPPGCESALGVVSTGSTSGAGVVSTGSTSGGRARDRLTGWWPRRPGSPPRA